ncbi:hypothetical protein BC833DRAFT_248122 [Globomyces pollinis-pini]|nr:hypothetical protein BC833DRAFT_248122 [Globomyces pollinis-pini]
MTLLQELDDIQEGLLKDFRYLTNDDFKGHCYKCKEPIIGKVTSYTQNDLRYNFHAQCFVCTSCSTSMEGKSFYNHESNHLCMECYHTVVLGKCDRCHDVFKTPTVVKAGGKQYHQECFVCIKCKSELTSTYIEKDNQFFCKACYEAAYLPPCGACGLNITPDPGSNKLTAIEWKEKKFHIACFSCKLCKNPFQDLKAVISGNDLLCRSCFEAKATQAH